MKQLEHHIFVCTNERDAAHPRGDCSRKDSMDLVKAFKQGLKDRKLVGQVRAQRAGCLDVCEQGPTVVIYPGAIWYGKVQINDVDEIIEQHVVGGKPVERLFIPGK